MVIKYKRLSENAIAPVKAHGTDAGFDLTCTRVTTEVNERGQVVVVYHTDIAVEIPEGYFGLLVARSSIANKTLILTNCAGVISSDDRGEVIGKFHVTTDVIPSVYKDGERFAQLLILPVPEVQFEEAAELSTTERGEGGYGSTDNISAATGSQSLPETEGEPINSETATGASGGAQNSSEQA